MYLIVVNLLVLLIGLLMREEFADHKTKTVILETAKILIKLREMVWSLSVSVAPVTLHVCSDVNTKHRFVSFCL